MWIVLRNVLKKPAALVDMRQERRTNQTDRLNER
jgi:hypothetical protein